MTARPNNSTASTASFTPVQLEPVRVSTIGKIYESEWFSYIPTIVGIFVLWYLATDVFGVPAYLIPRPVDVFSAMYTHWPLLLRETLATLREILGGFAIAVATAVPLALMIVYSRVFERFVNPVIIISQAIPKVAIAPLFLVWFGFGEFPKMLIAALIAFFPMLIACTVGLKGIDPEMLSMARSMGATPSRTFFKLRLPIALPNFFGGFKLAITFSVIGAVIGEFVGGDHGIGYLIQLASGSQQLDLLFAGLIVLSALSLILFFSVEAIERKVCAWHPSQLTPTA
ncbi:ABC transporter permease [Alcaligenaceae bacterium]|nr:ABC transporter permease [Alcaligenaceae bacterium]